MPDLQGTNVAAPVRPYNTECTYPTAFADEIAGGLKYVESESALSAITPERRPVGTLVSVGFGKFRQWTGTQWKSILQGADPPRIEYTNSDIQLKFTETTVSLKPATATSAGIMLPGMYSRLMGHASKHLQDGDDAIASTVPRANTVPQADKTGKLASGWLAFATKTQAGLVRVADDGESPRDEAGAAAYVVRASDSRLAQIAALKNQLDILSNPVRYVDQLPNKSSAIALTFYCIKNTGALYLLVDNVWLPVGSGPQGEPGKSAFEVAQLQGYEGSIDQWLEGLKGADALDGQDGLNGKSAYELARDDGFTGTLSDWLDSLIGKDGRQGIDGKSAYGIACDDGFSGTLTDWLESLKGRDGEDGAPGKSAFELATDEGFGGTFPEWLESLKGAKGDRGDKGDLGDGRSAYELAVENGFDGTTTDWLDSLRGRQGEPGTGGKSAFLIALDEGFDGTVSEWLESLIGPKGDQGVKGEKGDDGRGIEIQAYYDSLDGFLAAHETGSDGDCYGVEGNLYVWAGDRWENVGKLIGASAFEVWLEQPGNFGKSFDDFFDELAERAFSEAELASLIQSKVAAWMTTHIASVLAPIVDDWLNRNLEALLAARLPVLLETSFTSHIDENHCWQPM